MAHRPLQTRTTRRRFLKTVAGTGAAATLGLAGAPFLQGAPAASGKKPNFLFILTDQQGLDTLSAHGCTDAHTPNMDRLARRGVSFLESHSTSPVCSPARSSMMTGRMPVETGVISNDRPIHESCPNMGQWFRPAGYETVYCGKWHLPGGYPVAMPGFAVLPIGASQGDMSDEAVSRTCEAYLKSRTPNDKPFVFVASLLQPHDICYWAIKAKQLVPPQLPFPELAGSLPALPPNHNSFPKAPAQVANKRFRGFTDDQWRYYIYIYYRMVEMLDSDVGRILDALEDSGEADNTIVVYTSDHGEGRGRHQNVQKWHPYDESMKVPLIFSAPGRMPEGVQDSEHLVTGLDILSTMCDYAGIDPPPNARGLSLRPLLDGKAVEWREFVQADTNRVGRILRTNQYKYVWFPDDPVEQLFDMQVDPWETKNLYDDPKYADAMRDHRRLLKEWQDSLSPVEPTPTPWG
jgi:arylsulfatase A-like enzyme